MSYIKFFFNKIQTYIIHMGLVAVLILLSLYVFSSKFRCFLQIQNIDPNFIIGFFTVIALLLSLIQSSKDKRYGYNLQLIKSVEDKGLLIIAKLISIKNKSLAYVGTIETIRSVLKTDNIYKDTNNVLSKSDVEKDMELSATYADTFFPDLKQKWNDLTEKLSKLGTLAVSILHNYDENKLLLRNPQFTNYALDNIDTILETAKLLNKEIEALTLEMRDSIIKKINISTGDFKKTFDFKF